MSVLRPNVQAVVAVEAVPAAGEAGCTVDVWAVETSQAFSLRSDHHHLTAVHHPLKGIWRRHNLNTWTTAATITTW